MKPIDKNALDLVIREYDDGCSDQTTIRDYLKELLCALVNEEENFSAKRPFGNSGWLWNLFIPLIQEGYISGELECEDDICDIVEIDLPEAKKFLTELIVEYL